MGKSATQDQANHAWSVIPGGAINTAFETLALGQMDSDVLGFIAATLTTVAFLPQALKIIRTRDTRAISLSMYVTFTVGIALWLGYGVALNSWPMILSNAVVLPLAATILTFKLRYG